MYSYFEKNRYFFGKLMTVRDFEAEQAYVNGKRQLQNRMISGTGIIRGLRILLAENGAEMDSKDISDNQLLKMIPGVALTGSGKEINVYEDKIFRLSDLKGYNSIISTAYLCLEYFEYDREPVPAPVNSCACGEEACQYNRTRERGNLVIRNKLPSNMIKAADIENAFFSQAETITTISNTFVMTRKAPRWVNPSENFPVTLTIRNNGHEPHHISIIETLTHINMIPRSIKSLNQVNHVYVKDPDTLNICKVIFNDVHVDPGVTVEISYLATAGNNRTVNATITSHTIIDHTINPPSVTRDTDGPQVWIDGSQSTITVTEEPILDLVVKALYQLADNNGDYNGILMNATDTASDVVCLAKIAKISGNKFKITLNNTPEFVYNNKLLYSLMQMETRRMAMQGFDKSGIVSATANYEVVDDLKVNATYDPDRENIDFYFGIPKAIRRVLADTEFRNIRQPYVSSDFNTWDRTLQFHFHYPNNMVTGRTGTVYFNTPEGVLPAGSSSRSDYIDPQLGAGPICVNLGIEYAGNRMIKVYPADIALSAVINRNTGKFKIEYKALVTIEDISRLNIRWWAFQINSETLQQPATHFRIWPKQVVTHPGGKVLFHSALDEKILDRDAGVIWRVKEVDTDNYDTRRVGTINGGVYTAPGNEGTFSVEAVYLNPIPGFDEAFHLGDAGAKEVHLLLTKMAEEIRLHTSAYPITRLRDIAGRKVSSLVNSFAERLKRLPFEVEILTDEAVVTVKKSSGHSYGAGHNEYKYGLDAIYDQKWLDFLDSWA